MRNLLVLTVMLAAVVGLAGCVEAPPPNVSHQVYEQNIDLRERVFAVAQQMYPAPVPQDFPFRRDLVKYTERQAVTSHEFYIYVLGENGNVIGYFVGQTAPQNACNFLSETTKVGTTSYNSNVYYRQAPSLDGVYYGGTGSSGACDEWFFFDAATDALIKIRGLNYFTADQQLKLDAQPIEVRTSK